MHCSSSACSVPQQMRGTMALLTSTAAALSAGSWATASRTAQLKLGLLPFPISEALLPGESKQVHLYEARFIQLFVHARESHSCCGQMLFTDAGDVVGVTSLLEVQEYRQESVGVWARLRCVGRVQLNELEQTDFDYVSAKASLLHDEPDEPVESGVVKDAVAASGEPLDGNGTAPEAVSLSDLEAAAALAASREGTAWREQTAGSKASLMEALQRAAELSGVPRESILESAGEMLGSLETQLREAHASVAGMRRRLKRESAESEEGAAEVPSTGETDETGTRVEWGHELSRWTVESCSNLDEIADRRRTELTSVTRSYPVSGDGDVEAVDGDRGDGGARAEAPSLLEAMGPVWRVDSEAEAERQLLSYAAVATLPTNERVLALSMTSTTERLLHALCALRVHERRLAALLALRQAETQPGDETDA